MGTEVTLPVPVCIMASAHPRCAAQSLRDGTGSRHHFPPVGSRHPSAQSSAVHHLSEEETEHYAMANYKMSLSVLCKGAESEYKLTAKEISPRESTKATMLNLLNLTPFLFFSLQKFQKSPGKCNGPDCICSTWIMSFLKTPQNSTECSSGFAGKSHHWLLKKSLSYLCPVLQCFA